MAFVNGSSNLLLPFGGSADASVLLSSGADGQFEFSGDGNLVKPVLVASLTVLSPTRFRLDFDAPLALSDAATKSANYTIVTATPGAVQLAINTITQPDSTAPKHLIFDVSEMTQGATYTLTVVGEVLGLSGAPIVSGGVNFTGVGAAPGISRIVAESTTTARLHLNEAVRAVGAAIAPATYSFDNGLSVLAVVELDFDEVLLRTSEQDPDVLYTLTVNGVIADYANNAMVVPATAPMIGYQGDVEVNDALRIRMYDFLLKAIRDEDQKKSSRFVERFLTGPQEVWNTIHQTALSIPILWDVENTPDGALKFLKNIVGWTAKLNEVTAELDAPTLRRLIAASVAFWKQRGPEDAIVDILRLTTGARVRVLNWFDFRWVSDVTHLGNEWDANDPWTVYSYNRHHYAHVTPSGAGSAQYKPPVSGITTNTTSTTVPAGDFDAMVVFVNIKSTNLKMVEVKFRDMRMAKIAEVRSSAGPSAYSAWIITGLAGLSGELSARARDCSGPAGANFVLLWRGLKNVGRIRNIPVATSYHENGSGVTKISGGISSLQDADNVIVGLFTDNKVARPAPVSPLLLDVQTEFSASTFPEGHIALGTIDGLKAGVAYEANHVASDAAASIALSLTGIQDGSRISGGEIEYQIRIVDDGTLNKRLVRSLVKLTRPLGECAHVLYLGFLDQFTTDDDDSQWAAESGTIVVSDGTLSLEAAGAERVYASAVEAAAWCDYVFRARVRGSVSTGAFDLVFYRSNATNYYRLAVAISALHVATCTLYKMVAGVQTQIAQAVVPDVHRGVYYTWTVEAVGDGVNGGTSIQVLVDEIHVLKTNDGDVACGSLGFGHAGGDTVEVDAVEMHFLPVQSDEVCFKTKPRTVVSQASSGVPAAEGGCMSATENKNMAANATVDVGDLATSQPLVFTPHGFVTVMVNGLAVTLGDGTVNAASYFSDDGGLTAKAWADIESGDQLYWNGIVAGYELTAEDRLDFLYNL